MTLAVTLGIGAILAAAKNVAESYGVNVKSVFGVHEPVDAWGFPKGLKEKMKNERAFTEGVALLESKLDMRYDEFFESEGIEVNLLEGKIKEMFPSEAPLEFIRQLLAERNNQAVPLDSRYLSREFLKRLARQDFERQYVAERMLSPALSGDEVAQIAITGRASTVLEPGDEANDPSITQFPNLITKAAHIALAKYRKESAAAISAEQKAENNDKPAPDTSTNQSVSKL